MDGGGERDREREISMPIVLFIRTTPMNKIFPEQAPHQDPVAGQSMC